ncbi:MAG TPA: DUF2585 family protein [Pirellulales bacterium]|nr:DUF2585 family protein [Pirellulales bacterium]
MSLILAATAIELHYQGRLWRSASGRLLLWVGDVWSSENSQQLFDPYSFTHVLHGFVLCGLAAWAVPRWPLAWRLCLAIALEAAWEIIENTPFIIDRYRQATIAAGYEGDTVINSLGDVLACGAGFLIAQRLGWRWSLAVFIAIELALLIWIRDSLLLNVLMLVYPFPQVKAWQMGS